MPRRDFLPGDGSIHAIRSEHELNRVKLADGRHEAVHHPCFARVEKLLAEIDRLEEDLEGLVDGRHRFPWPAEDE
jgi:hypothetical protein